jgi:hypothetical protein
VNEPYRREVESGYDLMAEQYLATKDPEDPCTGGGKGDEAETWLWVLASKRSREGAM